MMADPEQTACTATQREHDYAIVARISRVSARMSRRRYEETASVEFQLHAASSSNDDDDVIRPVADLPSRASLRTAFSGDLYVPRTRR